MDILLMVFGLLLVVSLMLLLAWGVNKLGLMQNQKILGLNPKKEIRLIEQFHIDPKRKIVVVEIGTRQYALLTGGASDLVIDKDIALKSKNDTLKT